MSNEDVAEKFVHELGKFKIGDGVSSYHCEDDNLYMPGIGIIIAILVGRKRPYICEHDRRLYQFKENEIDHHDMY